MDPTAPDNNQPNTGSTTPQSPIQPGQFVVAGDDQQAPQAPTPAPVAPQAVQDPVPTPPQPAVSLAGERQESIASQVLPNAPVTSASTQPDPTPFTAPGQAIGQQIESAQTNGGGGSKMKGIIIALALLALLTIIGAVVYFFVLPKLKENSAKTQTSTDVQIEEPSPPPQRTGSGFGDIPDSTTSAEQVPPAVPDSPTTQTTPAITNSNP